MKRDGEKEGMVGKREGGEERQREVRKRRKKEIRRDVLGRALRGEGKSMIGTCTVSKNQTC